MLVIDNILLFPLRSLMNVIFRIYEAAEQEYDRRFPA